MKRWHWFAIGAIVMGSVVAEQFAHHEHHYWFTDIPAFFVVYGFVGCVAIIYLSKWYGKHGVQRPEDYYTRHGDLDGHRALTDPKADDGEGRSAETLEPASEEEAR